MVWIINQSRPIQLMAYQGIPFPFPNTSEVCEVCDDVPSTYCSHVKHRC